MFALGRAQRFALFTLSAAGYAVWLAGADASLAGPPARSPGAIRVAGDASPRLPDPGAIAIRDPFAGGPGPDDATNAPDDTLPDARTAEASSAAAPSLDVPNIDVAAIPPANSSAPANRILLLRATIVGRVSVAYVTDGDALRLVRTGDHIGARRVAAIALDSLTLDDGTRLELAPRAASAAPPAPRTGARGPHARRRRPGRLPAPVATATPPLAAAGLGATATPVFVTPEPLRTPDARGLAPGVNPTPDLSDPTALPYPYPYAPGRR